MDNIKDLIYSIEAVQEKALKVDGLVQVLNDAIYEGPNDAKTYTWAFATLSDLSFDLRHDLEVLTKNGFDLIK